MVDIKINLNQQNLSIISISVSEISKVGRNESGRNDSAETQTPQQLHPLHIVVQIKAALLAGWNSLAWISIA